MYQPSFSPTDATTPFVGGRIAPTTALDVEGSSAGSNLFHGVLRRWRRERRRRKVGRSYDMALEIARIIPRGSEVLDVGCGNGFIAQHLSGLLGARVIGIDLAETAEAAIDYRRFDGAHFPVADESVDALLLCYVLHHAQDLDAVLREVRRTLRDGGLVMVYEDIPDAGWDRFICTIHNLKWKKRSGPCTFRSESEWANVFRRSGFEVMKEKQLSRWRNLAHPVRRRQFVLRLSGERA